MKKLLAAALCLIPTLAFAQSAIRQSGSVNSNDAVKWQQSGVVKSAGTVFGDNTGVGVNPFAATDSGSLGVCTNSATTSSSNSAGYTALCLGHDGSGNGIISQSSGGGHANEGLFISLNGTLYPFPGAGNGNVIGPTSPTPTANDVAIWNGGTTLKDGGTTIGTMGGLILNNDPVASGLITIKNQAGVTGGLFENVPGLQLDLTAGTSSVPITAAGPSIHVARTENIQVGTCNGIFNNNECNSAVYGFTQNIGGGNGGMQINGVMGGALGFSTVDGAEAVGVQGLARAVGVSNQGVAGGYFEGRYDSTAPRSYYYTVGVEARTNNQTGVDAVFDHSGGNNFNSFLATSSAHFVPTSAKVNAGLMVTNSGGEEFQAGVVLSDNCCVRGLYMTLGNANQMYIASEFGNNSVITMDNTDGGHQTDIYFQDASVTKWQIGKNESNNFFVYDAVNAQNMIVTSAGSGFSNLFLGEASGTTQVFGTLKYGTFSGSTCTNNGSISIQDSGGTTRKVMICS